MYTLTVTNDMCIIAYLEYTSHYFNVIRVFLNFYVDRRAILTSFKKNKKKQVAQPETLASFFW